MIDVVTIHCHQPLLVPCVSGATFSRFGLGSGGAQAREHAGFRAAVRVDQWQLIHLVQWW